MQIRKYLAIGALVLASAFVVSAAMALNLATDPPASFELVQTDLCEPAIAIACTEALPDLAFLSPGGDEDEDAFTSSPSLLQPASPLELRRTHFDPGRYSS